MHTQTPFLMTEHHHLEQASVLAHRSRLACKLQIEAWDSLSVAHFAVHRTYPAIFGVMLGSLSCLVGRVLTRVVKVAPTRPPSAATLIPLILPENHIIHIHPPSSVTTNGRWIFVPQQRHLPPRLVPPRPPAAPSSQPMDLLKSALAERQAKAHRCTETWDFFCWDHFGGPCGSCGGGKKRKEKSQLQPLWLVLEQ